MAELGSPSVTPRFESMRRLSDGRWQLQRSDGAQLSLRLGDWQKVWEAIQPEIEAAHWRESGRVICHEPIGQEPIFGQRSADLAE